MLQASTYHEDHGIAVAAPCEQFDGSRFYDVSYVRTYRARMLEWLHQNNAGFGLDFGITDHPVSIRIISTNVALFRFELANDVSLAIAVKVADDCTFIQHAKAINKSNECILVPYSLGMNVSLHRASYAQLTEGGPVPLPPALSLLRKIDQTTLLVNNPYLGAQLSAKISINGQPSDIRHIPDQDAQNSVLRASVIGKVCVPPGQTMRISANFRFESDLKVNARDQNQATLESDIVPEDGRSYWKHDELMTTFILRRNVDYILGNCVIPISESTAAIITDHVALPLGWNRDN